MNSQPDEVRSRLDSRHFKGGLVFRNICFNKMNAFSSALPPVLASLALPLLLLSSTIAGAAELPSLVLLPSPGSQALEPQTLLLLEEALRAKGATVLSRQSFLLAAEELEISAAELAHPESIQRLASSIAANGVLFVSPTAAPPLPPMPQRENEGGKPEDGEAVSEAERSPKSEGSSETEGALEGEGTLRAEAPLEAESPPQRLQRQGLRLQVFDDQGQRLWDGEVALASRELSRSEASALASFAVSAVDEHLRAREGQGGGERETSALTIADEVIRPAPSSLALARLGADVNFTYRDVRVDESLRQGSDLDPGSLAFGAGVRFDSYPFPLSWGGRFLGIGVDYSYANHTLLVPGTGGHINLPVSDHRVVADLIGRFELGQKNRLLVRGGFVYSAFVVEDSAWQGSEDHMSGRLALEFERKLPAELEVWLRAGVRPFTHVGRDLPRQYGDNPSSLGWDARITLSGPLDGLIPLLRWTVGYDHLGYSDRYSSANGVIQREELHHRIFVGMIWAKD